MPTLNKNITASYVDMVIPVSTDVYVQNKGSVPIELVFATALPASSVEGLRLYPGELGINFTLAALEFCYAKTEEIGGTSVAVFVH